MPPKLKRGPPYDDDPGCKYIVIEDPWPGDATGKDRGPLYFNLLCAWVRFMLNKEHEVECVFAVNTRNEVIVQLPQDVNIVPILGAHPWRKVLAGGHRKDINRVSYVFAYDYCNKGDPAKHNWQEIYPTVTGDPPEHLRFPVKFPYPHVSWASPRGKNCNDIALPLPPMRQPTPVPDTSLFAPYQHPSQLTADTVSNAEARHGVELQAEQQEQSQGLLLNKLGKTDPYDKDAHALRSLRQPSSTADVQPRIKTESHNAPAKEEPALYGPSKSFRSAIEELQQARSMNTFQPLQATEHSATNGEVTPKREDSHSVPSESFVAAFNEIRHGHRSENAERSEATRAKMDPDLPPPPSESFVTAFNSIRGMHDDRCSPPAPTPTETIAVKQEATNTRHPTTPPADNKHINVKLEQDVRNTSDPRRAIQDVDPIAPKRAKGPDHADGPSKRFKRENYS
ncbi:hypothetical protein C8T65DRAFT_628528 [Cerioporus squamosus]|nr:hypothetical protein C8T65DRAFT_628528 [Cerioporus squamosus]